MEKIILDEETKKIIKEVEKEILGAHNENYWYGNKDELDLDFLYGMLDEILYAFRWLKREKEQIEEKLYYPEEFREE